MKKLISVILFCLTMLCVVGCESLTQRPSQEEPLDSMKVAMISKSVVAPEFTTTKELISFVNQKSLTREAEDVVAALPDRIIEHIGNVCINNVGYCSIETVFMEYTRNKNIYDNLYLKETTTESNDTVESPILRYTERDTIINGKPTILRSYNYE